MSEPTPAAGQRENLRACSYHLLRYVPSLLRDEWINIGVVLLEPGAAAPRVRVVEEDAELARLRRLHPQADLGVVRGLAAALAAHLERNGADPAARVAGLEQTLSNVLQLGPRKAVLTADPEEEFQRLYAEQVGPPAGPARPGADPATRVAIRARVSDTLRRAGVLERVERGVRVEEFTYPGDPMRLDFAYRRNGTRGFIHALPLARDPSQAKALAFTAGHIRARLETAEFAAVTETAPRPGEPRHAFVAGLLAGQGIELVPLPRLGEFVNRLRPGLR